MRYLFIFILVFTLNNCGAMQDAKEVFSEIYSKKIWGVNQEGEGWSGLGSAIEHTEVYRKFLQDFLKTYHITSVVDLGCGDWEFSRCMNWNGIDYSGIDVVPTVIKKNRFQFENDHIHFYEQDALTTELPPADLLICKDVLQHLTNHDICILLWTFTKYRYCLITNGFDLGYSSTNCDIERGSYRSLDLTRPPFNVRGQKILTFQSHGVNKQTLLITNW